MKKDRKKIYGRIAIAALEAFFVLAAIPTFKASAAITFSESSIAKLPIRVLVDAKRVNFPDVQPVIKNETTMIPLRFVTQSLGGKLSLQGKNITIIKDKKTVKLTIGSNMATVDGKAFKLNVSSIAQNGRTLVPLRFVSEGLGEQVNWDSAAKFVWIGSRKVPNVEDVIKEENLNPYKSLFSNYPELLKYRGTLRTKALVFYEKQLPLDMEKQIIYRIDKVIGSDGLEYLRSVSNDSGTVGTELYLLQKGQPVKGRSDVMFLRDTLKKSPYMRVTYIRVISEHDSFNLGISNYKNLRLNQLDYFGFSFDNANQILMRNEL